MAKRKVDVISGSQRESNQTTKKAKTSSASKANSDAVINIPNSLTREGFRETYIEPAWLKYTVSLRNSVSRGQGDDEPIEVELTFKRAEDMKPQETKACLDLVRETSKGDYEKSKSMGGWNDSRKRKELKDKDMRFLLLRRRALLQLSEENNLPTPPSSSDDECRGEAQGDNQGLIEGFLSFMLDHDSCPCVPVLYIYEIHLKEALRGKDVGGHLMRVAEGIGAKVGVDKLMLTCLMSNDKAMSVYEKFGFGLDAISPVEKVMRRRKSNIDHVIMSKSVKKG